jgi:hypothetical protein
MKTIQLKGGECSHNHSDRMVRLARKWLLEYFSDGISRQPGDLEDDFAGQWSMSLQPWRHTPFFPALALLVDEGCIVFENKDDGYWYSLA